MKHPCKISETEWQLMRVLWKEGALTSAQLMEHLHASDSTWHSKTVGTLLGRLVQKGALQTVPEGRAYLYRPLVSEKECVAAATDNFLKRMFGGSLKPMLAHFLENRPVSPEELQELRDLLNSTQSQPPKKKWKPSRNT